MTQVKISFWRFLTKHQTRMSFPRPMFENIIQWIPSSQAARAPCHHWWSCCHTGEPSQSSSASCKMVSSIVSLLSPPTWTHSWCRRTLEHCDLQGWQWFYQSVAWEEQSDLLYELYATNKNYTYNSFKISTDTLKYDRTKNNETELDLYCRSTQWAAVAIHSSLIRVPPQKWLRSIHIDTW